MTVPATKKQKVNDDGRLRCEFFLEKKRRYCSMQRKSGQKYCSEHMIHDLGNGLEATNERVPCPLDSNHTVWVKDLTAHLQKCNSKPKEVQDAWFKQGLNLKIKDEELEESDEDKGMTEEELFEKYIAKLANQNSKPLRLGESQHEGLDMRVAELTNKKHAIQQSSLIGNLKERGLLGKEYFYLEYGCGRGELSRTLNLCLLSEESTVEESKMAANNETPDRKPNIELQQSNEDPQTKGELQSLYGFGLVDRGVNRRKFDTRILKDCKPYHLPCAVRRSRIDIKDLSVDNFIADLPVKKVVAISKHLCGAATDLTLKLIINSSLWENDQFGGMLIAMCCRHACLYDQLLPQSRQYLRDRGFATRESFTVLKKIVSWAVSGTEEDTTTSEKLENKQVDRETLGLLARRLIDDSRLHALQQVLPERFTAEMFLYTDKKVTLENSCLCILQKSQLTEN